MKRRGKRHDGVMAFARFLLTVAVCAIACLAITACLGVLIGPVAILLAGVLCIGGGIGLGALALRSKAFAWWMFGDG